MAISYEIICAEALGKEGKRDEGLAALEEAEAVMQRSGELLCEAPLYWMRGELLFQHGLNATKRRRMKSPSANDATEREAERCLQHAIAVARRQEAKWFELYAVNTLGRLWLRQGKKAQARRLLTKLCSWFTEGFDTVDLQEAKVLLTALATRLKR